MGYGLYGREGSSTKRMFDMFDMYEVTGSFEETCTNATTFAKYIPDLYMGTCTLEHDPFPLGGRL